MGSVIVNSEAAVHNVCKNVIRELAGLKNSINENHFL